MLTLYLLVAIGSGGHSACQSFIIAVVVVAAPLRGGGLRA